MLYGIRYSMGSSMKGEGMFYIVNMYGERLSSYPDPLTRAEADRVLAAEAEKGWRLYLARVES